MECGTERIGEVRMTDKEKVIKKLTVRIQSDSEEWNTIELPIEQAKDILALLKEQEAEIDSLNEALDNITQMGHY